MFEIQANQKELVKILLLTAKVLVTPSKSKTKWQIIQQKKHEECRHDIGQKNNTGFLQKEKKYHPGKRQKINTLKVKKFQESKACNVGTMNAEKKTNPQR